MAIISRTVGRGSSRTGTIRPLLAHRAEIPWGRLVRAGVRVAEELVGLLIW